jgi:hypothetical protein
MQLARDHNWDDGFGVPRAVADHPNCDLAVALELFWLANADAVYLGEATERKGNEDWRSFSALIAQRVLADHYRPKSGRFRVPLTKVQIYNFRKKALPEVFLSDVEPGADDR